MPEADTQALTVKDVMRRLRVSRETVMQLLARGELTGFRLGRVIRIDPQSLARLLRRQADGEELGQVP